MQQNNTAVKLDSFGPWHWDLSEDIYKFCEALNFDPTDQQKEVLDAAQMAANGKGPRKIAIKSGKGTGKTAASAAIDMWWEFRHPQSKTIIGGPKLQQLKDQWIREIRNHVERADPLIKDIFNVMRTKVELFGDPLWCIELVTAVSPDKAHGYHDENLCIIIDEASGVSREIMSAFKSTITNENHLFLVQGNPTTRDSAFFDCFNSLKRFWKTFTFNSEDSPIVPKWRNEEIAEEYGYDSDFYRMAVLGEFPKVDPDCVISDEQLEAISKQALFADCIRMPRSATQPPAKQFGTDFAAMGDDESVTYRRSGNAIVEWEAYSHMWPTEVAAKSWMMAHEAGWRNEQCTYVIDATGMGSGVAGNYAAANKQMYLFHNGGTSSSPVYGNKITQAYFHFASLAKALKCYVPFDRRLFHQLSSRRYFPNKKGKLIIEPKDLYIARGFDSPDRAEACVMTFFDQVEAQAQLASRQSGGHRVGDVR